ncbi:site-specific DNA-methyltransferase [Marinilabilia salmonicolor]|uniref:site-specific DNA-methyltransferase (adenine-specific) n=1 Tax=Marinilabilia salmonicolor TaxID=989 RepID=A0A368USU9_9BACT|nr:site-specific DNA-methyltransferase [Marinilabilia salmonicolor]RCW31938.1 adenine-specific DNA-methyltransferase [Marinilabilia salmonicolor]
MDGKSLTPKEIKLKQLQELMPEVFSEGKVDFERLKATLGEDINFNNERYVLNWAGKSDAFRALQTPSAKTLVPAKDESVDFDSTENLFIEGENLEVLKVLQKSYFGKVKMIYIDPPYNTGNDSFIYPDKFSETKDEYQRRVGDKDEEGFMTKEGMFRKNYRENGQYHSNWLNMMYPRLFLSKNLLRDEGVIFISIGEDEIHNLRILLNEIFGEENYISTISRLMKTGGAKGNFFTPNIDYILVYAKNIHYTTYFRTKITNNQLTAYYNKIEESGNRKGERYGEERLYKASLDSRANQRYWIKCPDGSFVIPPGSTFPKEVIHGKKISPNKEDGVWKWTFDRYKKEEENGNIVFKFTKSSALVNEKGERSKYNIYNKLWLKDQQEKGKVPGNFIDKFENRQSAAELYELNIPFDYAKPSNLLKYLIQLSRIENDDIVLDFFAGSASIGHAVLKYNLEENIKAKFLAIQLPEKTDEKSEAFKAGYKTIADIAKERIRRAGKKIAEEIKNENEKKKGELNFDQSNKEKQVDTGFKVLKLADSNFKQWQQIEGKDAKALEEQMKLFVDPVSEKATTENMMYELLLKSGKDLNSEITHKEGFYCINNNEMVLMLEKATQDIVDAILKEKPQKVIALDRLFKGNDQLKTNTALQMKDAGVEFKTI